MKLKQLTCGLGAIAFSSSLAGAATMALDATADTTLIQSVADNNYGGRTEVLIGSLGTNKQRAGLLRFDTSALDGATINSITLRVTVFRTAATNSWGVNLMREGNAGWVEGTGDATVQAGTATWNSRANPSTEWLGGKSGARLGADVYGSMGTLSLTNGTDAVDDVVDTTLTVGATGFADLTALFDHWNTGSNNAGLQIYGGTGQWGIDSKEGTGAAQLIVDYTAVPEPSSTALLGLGGLALILRRRK